MTKHIKLLERFLGKPKEFTHKELVALLSEFGYREIKRGKTAGSRRAFHCERTKHLIRLHKPHPGNVLKMYQLMQVLEELKKEGLI